MSLEGIQEAVKTHYNNCTKSSLVDRNRSEILYLRNFNNLIKSLIILKFVTKLNESGIHKPTAIDLACGKGGDLLKWKKGRLKHVICADIADGAIEDCKSRYKALSSRTNEHVFSADFFTCDLTRDRLRSHFKDPSLKVDLVSCQFAFHYCFESFKQAQCMLRNAAESLATGGYFIATLPDHNVIMKRLRKAKSNSFGNSIYNLTFEGDVLEKAPPLFGAKYHFQLHGVVNCPEFLVYFPVLVRLAKKYNLKLIHKMGFKEFFENHYREHRYLISRICALEIYPNNEKKGDYTFAEEYLKKNPSERKVYTMSDEEWEVASLYTTFAFEKVKDGTAL